MPVSWSTISRCRSFWNSSASEASESPRAMRMTSPIPSDTIDESADASLADLFQNDRQRAIVDRLTGIMSLLEGHADVVMDGVGPEVIPSVAEIRRKFTERRKGTGTLDRLLRRLLGLDAKMRQYRDGAEFVREVNDKVGLAGFNAVWVEPANLPTKSEILDPSSWVARVHG